MSSCLLVGCVGFGGFRPPAAEGDTQKAAVQADPDKEVAHKEVTRISRELPPPPPPPSDYSPVKLPPVEHPVHHEPASKPSPLEILPAALPSADAASNPAPPVEAPAKPAPRENPLVAALYSTLEKHPDEAARLLASFEKGDRELLVGLLRLTAGIGKGELDKLSPQEVSATLERLHKLSMQLRQRASMTLEKVCLCRRIEGFGRREPVPAGYEFQAGSGGRPGERVRVYAEVRNFTCWQDQGEYETRLVCTVEIRNINNEKVASMNLGALTERSQTPLQDYFLNVQFHIPPRLPPGLYTLRVMVKDVTPCQGSAPDQQRVAWRSVDFKVGAAAP